MRYCPHCQRFNPGRPQFCHFCGRTWHVRLCPRGHENPAHVQYCGTCGSADLTDTAGPRSWFLVALKIGLWVLIGMSGYFIVNGIFNLLRPPVVYRTLTFVVIICLLILGFQLALSILPRSIGSGVRKMLGWARKVMVLVFVSFIRKLWEILR